MSLDNEQSPIITDPLLIEELTTRAVAEVYPNREALQEELASGRRLTAYMGIDPTAPDMHVGHESQLWKLKRLQDLGHEVILLIGDFTAMIGDPTDKSATRTKLSRDEVLINAAGYMAQASKIISFDETHANPARLAYNSEWLGPMDFGDVLELASEFTVQQMLERQMFRRRIDGNKPVGLHEFIYPMMQGWDSVKLGVDIEVGGSDQIFNMLVGSTLVKRHLNKQKYVLAGQLLVDPSGKKIGKTEGNMITLNDTPLDMFHKIMLWGDAITPHALELCSVMPMDEIKQVEQQLSDGEMSGLEGKMLLAKTIVTDLHGQSAATNAEAEYRSLTSSRRRDIDRSILPIYEPGEGKELVDILLETGLAQSKRAARELIENGAVRIEGVAVGANWKMPVDITEIVLQVGKRKLENHRLLRRAVKE